MENQIDHHAPEMAAGQHILHYDSRKAVVRHIIVGSVAGCCQSSSSYSLRSYSNFLVVLLDTDEHCQVLPHAVWAPQSELLATLKSRRCDAQLAEDVEDVADSVLPGGKDTVSICLITGFESFNVSLYNRVKPICLRHLYTAYQRLSYYICCACAGITCVCAGCKFTLQLHVASVCADLCSAC